MSTVSEKMRTYCKQLLAADEVEPNQLQVEVDFLKVQGWAKFENQAVVFEELGYSRKDWPDVVDGLVDQGLPEGFAKALKLAAKAQRGSNKSLRNTVYQNGERTMRFMKFQVVCHDDSVDALIALYSLNCTSTSPEAVSDAETEQSFKRFVEYDAQIHWRKDVKQFLQESSPQK